MKQAAEFAVFNRMCMFIARSSFFKNLYKIKNALLPIFVALNVEDKCYINMDQRGDFAAHQPARRMVHC